ncbi:hypothetical protein [Paraburkholderia sp. C35]|uniref:hypothetical protein n=1 Tax=Paraburkholderia sp. C35 TaxID=2126993 RepID=UPI000D68A301|nr:hypothetical protein [Paraburkholderia sp. C35]
MNALYCGSHRYLNKTLVKRALIGASVVAGSFVTLSAHACDTSKGGFLADIVKCVDPDAAPIVDPLDQLNGQTHFTEAAVAAGANAVVPGSGPIVAGGFALQQSGALPQLPAPQPMRPMQAPGAMQVPWQPPQPSMSTGGIPVQMQQPFQPPVMQMGNRCFTPPLGASQPGNPAPLGSPCTALTPYGVLAGRIVY